MVTLRNAAAPGDMGIIHPLLRRFQAGAASMIVFGLPAVLVWRWAFLHAFPFALLELSRTVPVMVLCPACGGDDNTASGHVLGAETALHGCSSRSNHQPACTQVVRF